MHLGAARLTTVGNEVRKDGMESERNQNGIRKRASMHKQMSVNPGNLV
jgi:hypothetical protein